jgi:hypothetical protein
MKIWNRAWTRLLLPPLVAGALFVGVLGGRVAGILVGLADRCGHPRR